MAGRLSARAPCANPKEWPEARGFVVFEHFMPGPHLLSPYRKAQRRWNSRIWPTSRSSARSPFWSSSLRTDSKARLWNGSRIMRYGLDTIPDNARAWSVWTQRELPRHIELPNRPELTTSWPITSSRSPVFFAEYLDLACRTKDRDERELFERIVELYLNCGRAWGDQRAAEIGRDWATPGVSRSIPLNHCITRCGSLTGSRLPHLPNCWMAVKAQPGSWL